MSQPTLILCSVLFVTTIMAFGQDVALRSSYESSVVYWKNNKLIQNGKKFKLKDFKSELQRFPDPMREYNAYKKQMNQGWLFYGLALASATSGLLVENQVYRCISGGVALGLLIPTIVKLSKGSNHLSKSLWYYNRDILLDSN